MICRSPDTAFSHQWQPMPAGHAASFQQQLQGFSCCSNLYPTAEGLQTHNPADQHWFFALAQWQALGRKLLLNEKAWHTIKRFCSQGSTQAIVAHQ